MNTSPSAKLPAELRNHIFSLALCHNRIILVPTPSDRDLTSCPQPRRLQLSKEADRSLEHPAALTQTCRQLRAETTRLFYNINTFVVKTYRHDYPDLIAGFRQSIGITSSTALQTMILFQNLGQGSTSPSPRDQSVSDRSLAAGTHGNISGIEIWYDLGDSIVGVLSSSDEDLAKRVEGLVQHCKELQRKANQEYARGDIEQDECVTRFWRLNIKKQNLRLAGIVLTK